MFLDVWLKIKTLMKAAAELSNQDTSLFLICNIIRKFGGLVYITYGVYLSLFST